MCVAMVIIHTKTLDKKLVDDASSTESLQLYEPPIMSQGTALFSCGIMECLRALLPVNLDSGQWAVVGRGCTQRPVGSSLESLWDGAGGTHSARDVGGISSLLHNLSLSEAQRPGSAAPPSKRQCRSLSCSDELSGCRSSWRPQGSRVWAVAEKRRCHSGGSIQRDGYSVLNPSVFPAMQRSSSFSLPTCTNLLEPFGHESLQMQQTRYLSHEQICPVEAGSPDSTPELQRRNGLSRSRSQPCVHNDKKMGVKRRRPADSQNQRPSLDLVKMTQKLQDFHSLRSSSFTEDVCVPLAFTALQPVSDPPQLTTKEHVIMQQSDGRWSGGLASGKERECWLAGLCGRRERDVQLGGELDIVQIERN